MSRLFISSVSHDNDRLIVESNVLSSLALSFDVVLKCNTPPTEELLFISERDGFHLIDAKYERGFGENNNIVFNYCKYHLGMGPDDYFLVLNPDVIVSTDSIQSLLESVAEYKSDIATINLFKDLALRNPEASIKKFPGILTPLKALFTNKHPGEYDKKTINSHVHVDWAAGSFLLFKSSIYQRLGGFDEKYFMYFEDVDICRRAKINAVDITYYPHIKATHFGGYRNRKILSRDFLWYLRSYIIYHFGL